MLSSPRTGDAARSLDPRRKNLRILHALAAERRLPWRGILRATAQPGAVARLLRRPALRLPRARAAHARRRRRNCGVDRPGRLVTFDAVDRREGSPARAI